jgi:capping protein alpha
MLVGDDESLEAGVLPALQQYNLEQFTVAEVPGAGHTVRVVHSGLTIYADLPLLRCTQSIVSATAQIPGEQDRFLDPRSKRSFLFDHLSLVRLMPLYLLYPDSPLSS